VPAAHGFDPSAVVDVEFEDVPYLRHGDSELLARVRQPAERTSGRRVVIVDVHGGAWCDNDRRFGKRYNNVLASHGAVVVAIDFRCGSTGPHPAGSTDVMSAVRWVRANADELGIDPALVIATGSSSGGHLAWLAALAPTHIEPSPAGEIRVRDRWIGAADGDSSVLGVAPLWPPLDPLARYRYAAGLDTDHGRRLVANTEAYFGTESRMAEASIADMVRDGHVTRIPPVLLVVAEDDLNVPVAITDTAESAYRAAGGQITVQHYPGVGHGFGHAETAQTERFDSDLAGWVAGLANTAAT
jgi:acetyl esterase